MTQSRTLRLSIAYIGFIILGLPNGIVGVAWPSIRDRFGLSQDSLGILLAAISVGYLLSSFFSGRAGARLGLGPLLAVSTFLSALGLLGIGLIGSWPAVVVLGLVTGLGTGTLDAGMNTSIAMNDGVRAMNWLHACWGLGSALGPVVMSAGIRATATYTTGYLAVGVLYVALGAVFAATIGTWLLPSLKSGLAGSGGPVRAEGLRLVRTPFVIYGMLVFLFYVGIELTAGQWSYTLFTESRGIAAAAAAGWVSLYWGSVTASRAILGFVGNRLPSETVLRICMVDILVASVLIASAVAPAVTFIGLALLGLGVAPIFPLLIAITPSRVGQANASDAIGFQVSAGTFGGALLPALAGVLGQQLGLEAIAWLMVGSAVVLLFLYERARSIR